MVKVNLLNHYISSHLLLAIDIFHNMFYSIYNIPAKPLPQGMLNYGGFFILGAE